MDSLLVPPAGRYSPKVLFKYHPPPIQRGGEQRFISMTMFETDRVPKTWLSLNTANLVINRQSGGHLYSRNTYLFPVITIPLPVNEAFYPKRSERDTYIGDNSKSGFITVGNYFFPDRKRLIDLITAFGDNFSNTNSELYVKTTIMDDFKRIPNIGEVCGRYE